MGRFPSRWPKLGVKLWTNSRGWTASTQPSRRWQAPWSARWKALLTASLPWGRTAWPSSSRSVKRCQRTTVKRRSSRNLSRRRFIRRSVCCRVTSIPGLKKVKTSVLRTMRTWWHPAAVRFQELTGASQDTRTGAGYEQCKHSYYFIYYLFICIGIHMKINKTSRTKCVCSYQSIIMLQISKGQL